MISKITGRLILLNIKEIVTSIQKEYEKKRQNATGFISAYKNSTRPFSDCRYVFFSINFFPYLLSKKDVIYDGHNFEMITAESINEAVKDGFSFIYPRYMSRTHGVAGGVGRALDKTDKDFFMESMKHNVRKILFDMHILPLR